MKSYRINDVKVTESNDGTKCVILNQNNLENCFKLINDHEIMELKINDKFNKYKDLSFLSECPNIEAIYIDNHFIEDLSKLYSLKNLKKLGTGEAKVKLELENLWTLEKLYITWHNKISGLSKLLNLKQLSIWDYAPKTRDLEEISNLFRLETLIITQSRIKTLKGISNLKQLKNLQLYYLRTLTDISDIDEVNNLGKLELENCKNIEDFSVIKNLNNLYQLDLFKCGDMENINFIKNLSNLRNLAFYGTKVNDGDLSLCMNVKNVHFDNKKHYSHKSNEFNNYFD
ncbi:leucine-rich repeat protein [Bacillus sp. AFS029533]|uniref:leucine-rich repeat protein n=1 Tax=Bacillus sp. AFS029533 TaxID=2033494 RepID=UPI000BFD7230|nr:leucine-rich repeat protein [Bacillus sp. AFS029533]PGZ90450.1 hypothetical protein COE53_17930 [Bacillus sp. AFS029533]